MLKLIYNKEEAAILINSLEKWDIQLSKIYSKPCAVKAYDICLKEFLDIEKFIQIYNNYIEAKKECEIEYYAITYTTNNFRMNDINELKYELIRDKGEWYTRSEIIAMLEKNYYVFIIQDSYGSILKDVFTVNELNNINVMTFKEASTTWNIGESTLRGIIRKNKLIERIDYWKSGGVWLITRRAMCKLYGENKLI